MKKYLIIIFILCFSFLFGANVLASTLDLGMPVIEGPLGLPNTDIRLVVARLINQTIGLLGMVTVLVILRGGLGWMTSFGDEEKLQKARGTIVSGIIGLVLIFSSYSIAQFVFNAILSAT